MASRRDNLREDAQLRIMRLIDLNPELSYRKIAEMVGISNGAAYYVVTELIKKGFLKLENFKNNPQKRQYAYLLTPKGIREKSILTFRFIERKKLEFSELREEIRTLEEEVGIYVEGKTKVKKNSYRKNK